MEETTLQYELKLPNDGSHDQGVNMKFGRELVLVQHLMINPEDRRFFQRIKIFENGFSVSEEVWRDYRILRFSHPFRQEGDELFFDF